LCASVAPFMGFSSAEASLVLPSSMLAIRETPRYPLVSSILKLSSDKVYIEDRVS
jgi:hypothetical protein